MADKHTIDSLSDAQKKVIGDIVCENIGAHILTCYELHTKRVELWIQHGANRPVAMHSVDFNGRTVST